MRRDASLSTPPARRRRVDGAPETATKPQRSKNDTAYNTFFCFFARLFAARLSFFMRASTETTREPFVATEVGGSLNLTLNPHPN